MSFALSMYGVPYAKTYNAAVALFEKSVPWRNGGDDRPLPNKRTRDMGVRMDGDDVVFRYHSTDVIRWHKDGSYTIYTGGYESRSTCEFASHFMPQNDYLARGTAHLRIGDRVYALAGQRVTVSETGAVSGPGLGVFRKGTVNRKKAKTLLTELGYYPYLAWYKLMFPMVKDTMPPSWKRRFMEESEVLGALQAGQEAYYDVLMSICGDPTAVRHMLYRMQGDPYGIWDYMDYDSLSYTDNPRSYAVVAKGV